LQKCDEANNKLVPPTSGFPKSQISSNVRNRCGSGNFWLMWVVFQRETAYRHLWTSRKFAAKFYYDLNEFYSLTHERSRHDRKPRRSRSADKLYKCNGVGSGDIVYILSIRLLHWRSFVRLSFGHSYRVQYHFGAVPFISRSHVVERAPQVSENITSPPRKFHLNYTYIPRKGLF